VALAEGRRGSVGDLERAALEADPG
jgi:hypothetical protein